MKNYSRYYEKPFTQKRYTTLNRRKFPYFLFGILLPCFDVLYPITFIILDKYFKIGTDTGIGIFRLGLMIFALIYYIFISKVETIQRKNIYFVLIISLVMFGDFIILLLTHKYDYNYAQYFYFFWYMSFAPFIWGLKIGERIEEQLPMIIKWFEIVVFFISLGLIIAILGSGGETGVFTVNYGVATYQSISYFSSFAFGMNLYYLFAGDFSGRYLFLKSKLYKVISVIISVMLVLLTILAGGRGAFVLLVFYFIIAMNYVFNQINRRRLSKILNFLLFMVLIIFIIYYIVSLYGSLPMFKEGFDRAIAYLDFSAKRIDLQEGSSGRNLIYLQALSLIKEKPFFGYGLFRYMYIPGLLSVYPHNIFLQILLQGGVVFFSIAFGFLGYIFLKLIRMIRLNNHNRFILFLWMYPLTMLLFSGSYVHTPLFWYCLSLVFGANKSYPKTTQSKIEEEGV